MLVCLFTAVALAGSYPLQLPPEADPGLWQVAASDAGFTLQPHRSGPGGTLSDLGSQWELAVADQGGQEHRVLIAAPHSAADRQAALSLAASLLRPAEWSMPALPPAPAAVPVAAEPVAEATPAAEPPAEEPPRIGHAAKTAGDATHARLAAIRQAEALAKAGKVDGDRPLPSIAPTPAAPTASPLAISLGYQLALTAGPSWRVDTNAGAAGSLRASLTQGSRWLGVGMQAAGSSAASVSASEWGAAVAGGWQRTLRRSRLQLGASTGLVVQHSYVSCFGCETDGLFGQEEVLVAIEDSVPATDTISYGTTALLPVAGVEAALLVPTTRRISLAPTLRAQVDLARVSPPALTQSSGPHPVQLQALLGVVFHDPKKR